MQATQKTGWAYQPIRALQGGIQRLSLDPYFNHLSITRCKFVAQTR